MRPLKQDHDVDALEAVLPVASNLGLPPEEEWADSPLRVLVLGRERSHIGKKRWKGVRY